MSQIPSEAYTRLLAAVDAGDDDAAEVMVYQLRRDDAPLLVQMACDAANDESNEEAGGDPPGRVASDRRWWAVRALAEYGGTEATPALRAALHAHDPNLRATAALAIGHVGRRLTEAAAPLLPDLATLLHDPDGFVRQAAVHGFSLCGDSAIPVLVQVLRECPHQSARTRAAGALRNLHSMAAAPALYECLNDDNPLVRIYAFEALDDLGLLETLLLAP